MTTTHELQATIDEFAALLGADPTFDHEPILRRCAEQLAAINVTCGTLRATATNHVLPMLYRRNGRRPIPLCPDIDAQDYLALVEAKLDSALSGPEAAGRFVDIDGVRISVTAGHGQPEGNFEACISGLHWVKGYAPTVRQAWELGAQLLAMQRRLIDLLDDFHSTHVPATPRSAA